MIIFSCEWNMSVCFAWKLQYPWGTALSGGPRVLIDFFHTDGMICKVGLELQYLRVLSAMDGLSGIKPKKAGRSPRFFKESLLKKKILIQLQKMIVKNIWTKGYSYCKDRIIYKKMSNATDPGDPCVSMQHVPLAPYIPIQ